MGLPEKFAVNIKKLIPSKKYDINKIIENIDGSSIIEINEEYINTINNTNFNSSFIVFIISLIYSDEFSLIVDVNRVLYSKNNKDYKYKWKKLHLINKNNKIDFDYGSFLFNISNEKLGSINLKKYLLELTNDSIGLDKLSLICESLLNKELDLHLDTKGNLEFNKTLKLEHG